MNKLFAIIILISLVTFSSCKKEESVEQPEDKIENYIQFKANEEVVDAQYKIILQDELFNAYYPNENYLEMRRLVENGNSQGIAFQISRFRMENSKLPITISYSTDLLLPTVTAIYTTDQNVSYGSSSDPSKFSVTINSYDEKVINCNFSGKLFTQGANPQEISLTEGNVNLELIEY